MNQGEGAGVFGVCEGPDGGVVGKYLRPHDVLHGSADVLGIHRDAPTPLGMTAVTLGCSSSRLQSDLLEADHVGMVRLDDEALEIDFVPPASRREPVAIPRHDGMRIVMLMTTTPSMLSFANDGMVVVVLLLLRACRSRGGRRLRRCWRGDSLSLLLLWDVNATPELPVVGVVLRNPLAFPACVVVVIVIVVLAVGWRSNRPTRT
jgi:hypothetical protein